MGNLSIVKTKIFDNITIGGSDISNYQTVI